MGRNIKLQTFLPIVMVNTLPMKKSYAKFAGKEEGSNERTSDNLTVIKTNMGQL